MEVPSSAVGHIGRRGALSRIGVIVLLDFSIAYSLPFSGPDFANLRRYGDEAKLLSPLVVSDRSGGLLARDFVVLLPSDRGGRNESLAGRSVLANSPSRFRDWLKIGWHW
ncbi:unnamed protein product [Toxocara canis]|uniref:Uncharacterized protein n=1 Tax=Toxocara canis TaxID=6265 RepID=A0A183U2A0_TOXCA|nr:unnamed protein product [Toxocara canis]